ncbi:MULTISPECIES: hypothetical protein [unclassified Campylobacter]|uniref:hypothetical protein n=1 Tax=unclassified Campylobacter TaxID=2593542 RepID=UPI001BD9825A|nr:MULTISPECIES: hypothetical protein [unclassified Campylobacter]MBT0880693.1 hypothetical protein [Campylobacter sp. 2018MI27]ULO04289.1 hypothetical protein AVBRAN_1850 [Campylobacter sp. RM12651]
MSKHLASSWKDHQVIYEDNRMQVISANYTNENLENAIGIFWKEIDNVANAYPVQGNAICPMRLNDELSVILLEGLKLNTKNRLELIEDLIKFYKNKQKEEK